MFGQRRVDLLEFRPQHFIEEGAGHLHVQTLPMHARVAVGAQVIAATQRHEQAPRPRIAYADLQLLGLLTLYSLAQPRLDPLGGGTSCGLFTSRRRPANRASILRSFSWRNDSSDMGRFVNLIEDDQNRKNILANYQYMEAILAVLLPLGWIRSYGPISGCLKVERRRLHDP